MRTKEGGGKKGEDRTQKSFLLSAWHRDEEAWDLNQSLCIQCQFGTGAPPASASPVLGLQFCAVRAGLARGLLKEVLVQMLQTLSRFHFQLTKMPGIVLSSPH